MKPQVLVSYLSNHTIDKILDLQKENTWKSGMVTVDSDKCLDLDIRMVSKLDLDSQWIQNLMFEIASEVNEKYNIESVNQCELLKYEPGGKFIFHQDVIWENKVSPQRKLTVISQLSDDKDYEGGDFLMKGHFFPKEIRKKGTVIVFPSNLVHQVNPVTSGTRYSCVAWAVGEYCAPGPDWR